MDWMLVGFFTVVGIETRIGVIGLIYLPVDGGSWILDCFLGYVVVRVVYSCDGKV